MTEGGQQTDDGEWRSQDFFKQVMELDRFSGGGEGGDGVPLGSLTQGGAGPFSLRAVVLQVQICIHYWMLFSHICSWCVPSCAAPGIEVK